MSLKVIPSTCPEKTGCRRGLVAGKKSAAWHLDQLTIRFMTKGWQYTSWPSLPYGIERFEQLKNELPA